MKYSAEKIKECAQWVRVNGLIDHGGATKKAFREAMDISPQTLCDWEKKSEFVDAIKKAKADYAAGLENRLVVSLVKSAEGYTFQKNKIELGTDKNGKPVVKKKTEETIHVAPNVGAAIFLLTNIAPDRWKNRQTQDVRADVKSDVNQKTEYDVSDIPEDLLFKMADAMQEKQAQREKAEKENGTEKDK